MDRQKGFEGMKNNTITWDPRDFRKIQEHPCYSKKAAHRYGRMHLAVAPKCNIQCNYCIRDFDCVNESRPGVTSEVLSPQEAVEKVIEVRKQVDFIKVIGIAGPGDPLYNDATFETIRLVKERFSDLYFCLSTNGLALPKKVPILRELAISHLTVTLNAVDPSIGEKIYSFVIDNQGRRLKGHEAAEILLENQITGIEQAVKAGFLVKINSILIPGINDQHLVDVAKKIKELGVFVMNVMSLIPQYKFAHIPPPSWEMKSKVQDECSEIIHQMKHCRQCRADAIGKLGKDLKITPCASSTGSHCRDSVEKVKSVAKDQFKIAVISSQGKQVDTPFGAAQDLYIFEARSGNGSIQYLEKRPLNELDSNPSLKGPNAKKDHQFLNHLLEKINDCDLMLCKRIGSFAKERIQKEGIQVVEDHDKIENAIAKIIDQMRNQNG